MEFQCLQTAVALIRVGIGRSDSMCSIRSALRELKSVIFGGAYGGERGGRCFSFCLVSGNGSWWERDGMADQIRNGAQLKNRGFGWKVAKSIMSPPSFVIILGRMNAVGEGILLYVVSKISKLE